MVQVDRISLSDPALEPRPEGAASISLGRLDGWQKTYNDGTEGWDEARVLAIETKGYRYYLIGTFEAEADRGAFDAIVATVGVR